MNERERRRRPSLLGLEDDERDLFGLAAHKLNTPIACLRGFVTTLLQRGEQLDPETVKQFHTVMLQQVDRLQGMVHNFLALARVQGGVEALSQPVRPRDILVELLDDVGPEGGRVKGAGDLDVKIATDGELLRSALRPLVENALTYGPRRKPVTVTVTIGGDRQRWDVRDEGSRLSQDELEQLFRPFTRANPAVERRGAGAGLGLTLARAYAEALRGQVGAKVDEQGTVFWLDLPAMAGEEMAS